MVNMQSQKVAFVVNKERSGEDALRTLELSSAAYEREFKAHHPDAVVQREFKTSGSMMAVELTISFPSDQKAAA